MSSTYTWGFSNTTPSEHSVVPTAVGMASNYVKKEDEPDKAVLRNKTTNLDQLEQVTYKSRSIKRVDVTVPVYNTNPVKDGVLYGIDLQAVRRETRTDGTVIDHPIEVWMQIKHDIDGSWTIPDTQSGVSPVGTIVSRLLGASYDEDGVERFDALAKSALVPTSD